MILVAIREILFIAPIALLACTEQWQILFMYMAGYGICLLVTILDVLIKEADPTRKLLKRMDKGIEDMKK